ncbi:hypothetical protein PYCCODRAFT_1433056 [Trametes coccinea BRFM310]|uniref:Uncharacterized protein n=1 Tax=Trametes coccinea (strain BRFM310) TaxID=1353009 RepID=A0A1Y2IVT5_TRAC3|nr:hypothetical protein PYCCODRAFT_1433056 [Trametes coccinea BRFM310]
MHSGWTATCLRLLGRGVVQALTYWQEHTLAKNFDSEPAGKAKCHIAYYRSTLLPFWCEKMLVICSDADQDRAPRQIGLQTVTLEGRNITWTPTRDGSNMMFAHDESLMISQSRGCGTMQRRPVSDVVATPFIHRVRPVAFGQWFWCSRVQISICWVLRYQGCHEQSYRQCIIGQGILECMVPLTRTTLIMP